MVIRDVYHLCSPQGRQICVKNFSHSFIKYSPNCLTLWKYICIQRLRNHKHIRKFTQHNSIWNNFWEGKFGHMRPPLMKLRKIYDPNKYVNPEHSSYKIRYKYPLINKICIFFLKIYKILKLRKNCESNVLPLRYFKENLLN